MLSVSLQRRANARNVSTSLLTYGGITYFINSFDYPNLFLEMNLKLCSFEYSIENIATSTFEIAPVREQEVLY